MQTTKNKIMKSIKILPNDPLYGVLLVISAGLGACDQQKTIPIRFTPSAEKQITTGKGNNVLEQSNVEEVCSVSNKQLKAGLKGNHVTSQVSVPVENSCPRSSNRNSNQLDQAVNRQGQVTPGVPNEYTYGDNKEVDDTRLKNGQVQGSKKGTNCFKKATKQEVKQEEDAQLDSAQDNNKGLNKETFHLDTSVQQSVNTGKRDIVLNQGLSNQSKKFITKINNSKESAYQLVAKIQGMDLSESEKKEFAELLKEITVFYGVKGGSNHGNAINAYLKLVDEESKQKISEAASLKCVKNLKEELEKIHRRKKKRKVEV